MVQAIPGQSVLLAVATCIQKTSCHCRYLCGALQRDHLWPGSRRTLQEKILMIGLLFGLPMAVVFARRDWEHAVGAHYMINMFPTLMVFLET